MLYLLNTKLFQLLILDFNDGNPTDVVIPDPVSFVLCIINNKYINLSVF